MTESLPIVLVPGLLCSLRLYRPQLAALWRLGPVMVADHTRDSDVASGTRRLLEHAPPRFALVALSMGGYLAFETLRVAPERVLRLALLDTTARSDTPEQSEARRELMALGRRGGFDEVIDRLFLSFVHRRRHQDATLRRLLRVMAEETGVEAFLRQETLILNRPDSRASLGAIRCPTTVLVGAGDELTPPELAREIAAGIPGARLVEIRDSGHLPPLETPEEATTALVEALTS